MYALQVIALLAVLDWIGAGTKPLSSCRANNLGLSFREVSLASLTTFYQAHLRDLWLVGAVR